MKTLYIVGGVALAGGLVLLLWPRSANAATSTGSGVGSGYGLGVGSGYGSGTGYGTPGGTAGGFGLPVSWSPPPTVVTLPPNPTQSVQETAKRTAATAVLTDTMRGVVASLNPIAQTKIEARRGGRF